MHFFWPYFSFLLVAVSGSQNPSLAQQNKFVANVLEYKPAPGQFINTPYGNPSSAQSLIGGVSGTLSLGGFGGYVVVGFDYRIENHPENPYGVDFTILGNASPNSSEPAAVYVMKDVNQNHLPDDTWYLLAGSDYYFSTSHTDYQVTYTNPNSLSAADVPWTDIFGNAGLIEANSFHTQLYYPLHDSFPEIPSQQYALTGLLVQPRIDKSDPAFVAVQVCPFGFADNSPRNLNYVGWEPNNPYTAIIEGSGGDGFDISWAVDSGGKSVDLDGIDFIKIQTAVNASAGWLGELSPEILGVVDVAPDISITGTQQMLVIEPLFRNLKTDEAIYLKAYYFVSGKPVENPSVIFSLNKNDIASIAESGEMQALKPGQVTVYARLSGDASIMDSLEIFIENPIYASETLEKEANFFPNPAREFIQFSENQWVGELQLINILGQRWVLKQESNNQFYLSDLPSGLYTIYYQVNGLVKSTKLIKN
ncbi:MAG: T9SS type A sorting domain-containing protein [Salinivirgaceae bacterium]